MVLCFQWSRLKTSRLSQEARIIGINQHERQELQPDQMRFLDHPNDVLQEARRRSAVNDAMIEGQ